MTQNARQLTRHFRWFSRDPRVYTYPETFLPERFLGATPEQDPRDYVFGFGRRVCPEQQLGEASVFAACAIALATVNISPALDKDGRETRPSGEFIERSIRYVFLIFSCPPLNLILRRQPKDFPCSISPRSAQHQALLCATYESSQ